MCVETWRIGRWVGIWLMDMPRAFGSLCVLKLHYSMVTHSIRGEEYIYIERVNSQPAESLFKSEIITDRYKHTKLLDSFNTSRTLKPPPNSIKRETSDNNLK